MGYKSKESWIIMTVETSGSEWITGRDVFTDLPAWDLSQILIAPWQ